MIRLSMLMALLAVPAAIAVAQKPLPPCDRVGAQSDREDCVRARTDSASSALARTIGLILERLPDARRRQFLVAEERWADSQYVSCRRQAAGPWDITPISAEYAACLTAARRSRTDSLAQVFLLEQGAPADHGRCLAYEPESVSLSGTLQRRTFPGRPNYESVARGDEAETGFYLDMATSLCVSRNLDATNVPTAGVTRVQLVLGQTGYDRLRLHLGKVVNVRGTLFHSYTGHHHAELLLQVLK